MSTPISKALIRTIVPAGDKVTTCCNSKSFVRNNAAGENRYICINNDCKNKNEEAILIVPSGVQVTKYKIRPLSPVERGRLIDESASVAINTSESGTKMHELVKYWVKVGLTGWENFEASFATAEESVLGLPSRQVLTDAAYNELPYEDTLDIAFAVRNYNRLSDDESKN